MAACEHCGQIHDEQTRFCPGTGKLIAERLLPGGSLLENKYRVGAPIGVGGMGAVFEATHDLLGHKVAIKVLLPELSQNAEMTSRLVREGRAACATGHPNIAMVTDMGYTRERSLFVVMEHLEGQTLNDIVESSGPLPLSRATELVLQVLAGLEAVHQASIVHRDLKPDNVMVVQRGGREVVKIVDFGISKVLDDSTRNELTATGLVFGTPAYMAPEQSKGAATVDHRADLYSVGAIYYKLLTGVAPVVGPTLSALLAKLVQGEIEPPSRVRPGLSADVDRVVLRSLALDPAGRFSDARSFRRALEPFCGPAPTPGARRGGPPVTPAPSASVSAGPSPRGAEDEQLFEGAALVHLDELAGGPDSHAGVAALPAGPASPAGKASAASHSALGVESDFAPPEEEDRALELVGRGQQLRQQPTSGPREPTSEALEPTFVTRGVGGTARRRQASSWRTALAVAACAVALGAGGLWLTSGDPAATTEQPQVEVIRVELQTEPAEVDVFVDGVLQVGLPIKLARSGRTFDVRVAAEGFQSKRLRLVADRDQRIAVSLTPLRRP